MGREWPVSRSIHFILNGIAFCIRDHVGLTFGLDIVGYS
jgi:hypothetical protein